MCFNNLYALKSFSIIKGISQDYFFGNDVITSDPHEDKVQIFKSEFIHNYFHD